MKNIKTKKIVVSFLAVMVVLLTIYSLHLPAVALTKNEAQEDPSVTLNNNTEETVDTTETTSNEGESEDSALSTAPVTTFQGQSEESIVYVEAPEGAFPEGTEMKIEEVAATDKIKAVIENSDVISNDQVITDIKAVDVSFYDKNDNKQEPEGTVKVSISASYMEDINSGKAILVHIKDDHTVEEIKTKDITVKDIETVAEATKEEVKNNDNIDEINTTNTVSFETDSFSTYAVVYTVDFYYGDYEYHLEGGKEIYLDQLFSVLGIDVNLTDVKDVEFSNYDLVNVYHVEGNWILESKKAFDTEESLNVTLQDGSEIIIKVKDDQIPSWDLANTNNTLYLNIDVDESVEQTEQERNASFSVTVDYSLKEQVCEAIDNLDGPFKLVYDLSSVISNSPIEIKNVSNKPISIGSINLGTYSIIDGLVTLNFTNVSYFDTRTVFEGYFTLTAITNEKELSTNDTYTYTFPGASNTITIKYKKAVEEGTKNVSLSKNESGLYTLHYSANVKTNSDLDSLVFNDTLSGLQSLVSSSVKINGTPVNVTQSGSTFTFNVGTALGTEAVSKGTYQVTYDTVVTEDQLKEMSSDKTTETNTATWTVNGSKDVPGGNSSIEIDKPKEPIPVIKTIDSTSNMPGDIVNYTITFGKDTTPLSNLRISDVITDVVIPQGKVKLDYNGLIEEIDFNGQSTDDNYSKGYATLFDYTFPDSTSGNGPVTVTYSVKLIDSETAKNNNIFDSTDVVNTAQEHRQNTTDTKKTTVEYEKEPIYSVVKSETSDKNADGKWVPGTEISYTLTIGDSNTNMSGVKIKDMMTDLQKLKGDVMIKIGSASPIKLTDYNSGAIKWTDDHQYSTNDVLLFDFSLPNDVGFGPIIITYTTEVISQDDAHNSNVFGEKTIKNTGFGGKQSDETSGVGVFDNYPIEKTVTQNGADVNGQNVEIGSTVHYRLVFGDSSMNMSGKIILDEMTYLQNLSSDIVIKKPDNTAITMPKGSAQWANDGVVWSYFIENQKYSDEMFRVFSYTLPTDIGNGPIIIEYDTTIISTDEANNAGIQGSKNVLNRLSIDNNTKQTDINIDFPSDPIHEPQIKKEFVRFDAENNKVYWNITVEKTQESAYPLNNVKISEAIGSNQTYITEGNVAKIWNFEPSYSDFDIVHAVVTSESGNVLNPGVDYSIDKNNCSFTFPTLNEKVIISLCFNSPLKIVDGYYIKNTAKLNDNKTSTADATYNNPSIDLVKNGQYDESKRIVTWTVNLNPASKVIDIDDEYKYIVDFVDIIPKGLTILNFENESTDNPSVKVSFGWRSYFANVAKQINENGSTTISANVHPKANNYDPSNSDVSVSGNSVTVTYKTLLSQEEWENITSSASGSKDFKNNVTMTFNGNQSMDAFDDVTITSNGYINKYDDTLEDSDGIVVIDPDSDDPQESKRITYTIEINPNGYLINHGNSLSLSDYISTNMDLDTSSVVVNTAVKGDDGRLIPAGVPSDQFEMSYNDDSRLLSIRNLSDRTPFVVKYSCVARAQGTDTFTNTATLIGGGSHSSSIKDEHIIQVNDAGVKVDSVNIHIHKIDENNISQNLRGAKFQLYECQLVKSYDELKVCDDNFWHDLFNKVNSMRDGTATQADIDYVKTNFKIKENGYMPKGEPIISGSDGYAYWTGLSEHKLYAWKEIQSPDGYTCNSDYHYFVAYQYIDVNSDKKPQPLLPDEELQKRKEAAWALDDACQFANEIVVASMSNLTTWTATNVENEFTSITATKVWEGDSDNLFDTRPIEGIKLQLYRINSDGTRTAEGSPVSVNVDESTGKWPNYIWSKLPSRDSNNNPIKYTIVEERVDNYTTSYSDYGEGQTSGTITITNKMLPKTVDIHVKKVFSPSNISKPNEIRINLWEIKTNKSGQEISRRQLSDGEWRLNESNNWSHTYEKLPTTDGTNYLTYTVVEDIDALRSAGFDYTVLYSDNGIGTIDTTEENPLTILNTKTGSVKVSKSFSGINQLPDNFKITASYSIEGVTNNIELKINGDNPENVTRTGTGTQSDPYVWTISSIPLNTEVTFTESGMTVNGYELKVNENVVSEDTYAVEPIICKESVTNERAFVNAYTQIPVEFSFSKVWLNSGQNVDWKDRTTIKVSLYGKNSSGQPVFGSKELTLTSSSITGPTEYEYSVAKQVDNSYLFTVKGLPRFDADGNAITYYVSETNTVEGYKDPQYGYLDENGKLQRKSDPSSNFALNGEIIINEDAESYELPLTGGLGSSSYYTIGAILIFVSIIYLFKNNRYKSNVK